MELRYGQIIRHEASLEDTSYRATLFKILEHFWNISILFVKKLARDGVTLEFIYVCHSSKISFQFWCTIFALKRKRLIFAA